MARTTLLVSPTFTPGSAGVGTLNFTGTGIDVREIWGVFNVTRGDVMIFGAVEGFGATSVAAGPIITLSVDTSSHSAGDVLRITGEEQSVDGTGITQPTGGKGVRGWLSGIYSALTNILSTNIAKIGNATIALGQAVKSSSFPVVIASDQSLITGNFNADFRDVFDSYVANGSKWNQTLQSGDIVMLDGNGVGSSYLVISKDPLTANGTTSISTVQTFLAPIEMVIGAHMSQRTLGQEFSLEYVSNETPLSTPSDVQISSVSQATTTLTVTTSTAHGLNVGQRIGIRDCNDSRINYPALVVASIPTTTQFTATAGPGGTIPSLTIGPFTSGYVFPRSALGYAPNGTSQIFENATATNASFYVRTDVAGNILPSGTVIGNHSVAIATTASVQAVNAAYTYTFQPTTEYRLIHFADNIQWTDVGVDSTGSSTSRHKRTQVVPDHNKTYQFRVRATNNPSLTRPIAKIVSYSKSGSTTATITTDVAHGLTTADLVNIYGSSNQTDFANLTTATAVASTPTSTTFTIIMGATTPTITSFGGGYVSRVNGGQTQQGAITMVVTNVVRTSNILTLTGSATWSGFSIGDYVNLVGIRKTSDGSDVGIDGSYRVRNFATTSLELEPIGSAPTGADIGSVATGGAVIKRTDLRLSFIRVLPFVRERVELIPRATGDSSQASVTVGNTVAITANSSVNAAQIGGQTPLNPATNGSTNRAIVAGLAGPTANTDYSAQAWAAASGSGAVIAEANGLGVSASFDVNLTAWTAGASTGLVVFLQESQDGATQFYDIWQTEPLTAVSRVRIPALPIGGRRRMRWVNLTGAATTATVTVTAHEVSGVVTKQVQFFDRTASVGSGTATSGTSTAWYDIAGCKAITVVLDCGAATAVASFQVEMSQTALANSAYAASAATAVSSTSANRTIIPLTAGVYGRFIRVTCTATGTSQTMNSIHIYGTN